MTSVHARFRELWAGVNTGNVVAGFGLRDRWLGPGRHGGLMLTSNASPAPAGSFAWEGRAGVVGTLRAEGGVGWLDGERRDVANPGWLYMDFRWVPVPQAEIGLSRVGIFGGEGRPTPPIGQLLVPTEVMGGALPHPICQIRRHFVVTACASQCLPAVGSATA